MAKDLTWTPSWTTEELKTWVEQKEWTWFDSTVDNASDELMKDLDSNWAKHIIPELTKTWKINKEELNKLYSNWAKHIIPELIKTWKINKEELNEFFKRELWAKHIIPELIKTWEINK